MNKSDFFSQWCGRPWLKQIRANMITLIDLRLVMIDFTG